MIKTVNTNNNQLDSRIVSLKYEEINVCPICKRQISPIYLSSCIDTTTSATIFNFCRGCNNSFVTKYKIKRTSETTNSIFVSTERVIYSEPNRFIEQKFDNKIETLSSQFVKIYNQALAAETMNLDEIAGLGYRKAMEFLVKDFAIHKHPESIETIKKQPLAQCINNYISSVDIKTLAERCAWIGNDEAHYVRVQEDRDVSDMKSFIQAMVYFIGMILITEDAASITPKK